MAIGTAQAGEWLTRTYAGRSKDMPISGYYRGKGEQVMKDMRSRYGEEKGERVFYATANARNENPEDRKAGQKVALKRARR